MCDSRCQPHRFLPQFAWPTDVQILARVKVQQASEVDLAKGFPHPQTAQGNVVRPVSFADMVGGYRSQTHHNISSRKVFEATQESRSTHAPTL